jgi:hypothetical protein
LCATLTNGEVAVYKLLPLVQTAIWRSPERSGAPFVCWLLYAWADCFCLWRGVFVLINLYFKLFYSNKNNH